MRGTHSHYIHEENAEFKLDAETNYNPPVINILGRGGSVQLLMTNEQLAELEYLIKTHLEGIRYPETPDQQMILHAECESAIEEGIA
jgi:hypothetical protein